MSREVVMKHLENMVNSVVKFMPNFELLGVRRPLDTQDFVMMTSVCPVKSERGEFAGEMIRGLPDLDMGIVSDRNVPIRLVVKMTSGETE